MSDLHLLVFGCGVSFIAIAGIYVYLRERYEGRVRHEASRPTARSPAGVHRAA